MKFALKAVTASVVLLTCGLVFAQTAKPAAKPAPAVAAATSTAPSETKGQTVKIAMIEGLSGAFANVGQNQLKSYQFVAERLAGAKNPAGVNFEFVAFDNKGSPQASLDQLKAAIDQGFRYVTQGNSSAVAGALSDAITKHNERNPGKEVVYLNYAAVDPALTNEKCSFWHFRLDADTSMKIKLRMFI
jgi:branched-chain amino acid transport system substrate-binding protein